MNEVTITIPVDLLAAARSNALDILEEPHEWPGLQADDLRRLAQQLDGPKDEDRTVTAEPFSLQRVLRGCLIDAANEVGGLSDSRRLSVTAIREATARVNWLAETTQSLEVH